MHDEHDSHTRQTLTRFESSETCIIDYTLPCIIITVPSAPFSNKERLHARVVH